MAETLPGHDQHVVASRAGVRPFLFVPAEIRTLI
jgi:hypothetical protein